MKNPTAPLIWETDLPLFSPEMLKQWSYAMLATALVMGLLLGTIFAAQGEWDALPKLGLMVGVLTGALWVLGLLIMAVFFRGRYHVRYTLSDKGILQETVDAVARKANRAAIILGVLARKPGLVGAGLIARSRESEAVNWKGAFAAVEKPARHLIVLRNSWRAVMFVQCTPENFDEVQQRVNQAMRRNQTRERVATNSPLPFYLRHTALILLASVPLFMLAEEYHLHLLAPILVLCFALTTLWLINVFAYVVYAGLLYLVVGTLMDLSRVRQSAFFPGESYSGFSVMGGEENGILLLALVGSGYLIWLSWRALHGGFLALLVKDHEEMDGG